MATFEIEHAEGMRWVKVELVNDDVRTERGALNHMKGMLAMDVPWPTLKSWWVSLFSDESLVRPRYSGTGTVYLDSSLGGYHLLKVQRGGNLDPRHKIFLGQRRRNQIVDSPGGLPHGVVGRPRMVLV